MAARKKHASSCCKRLGELLSPKLFKALGEPNRIGLLCRLAGAGGKRTVTGAATCCDVDVSVVSRHLAVLRDAGVLQAERRGKEVYYTVRGRALARSLRAIADALETCCRDED